MHPTLMVVRQEEETCLPWAARGLLMGCSWAISAHGAWATLPRLFQSLLSCAHLSGHQHLESSSRGQPLRLMETAREQRVQLSEALFWTHMGRAGQKENWNQNYSDRKTNGYIQTMTF